LLSESISLLSSLAKKHDLSNEQISSLLSNRDQYLAVPVGLFRSKLGPLESLVRYLKDVLELPFAKIARLLKRDETTIWTSYNNTLDRKLIVDVELTDVDFSKMSASPKDLVIPLSVFSLRKLSVLESLCVYLRETFSLSYHAIGQLLDRNDRTVWTAVNRAQKKLDE
jgi:hypothetical protein